MTHVEEREVGGLGSWDGGRGLLLAEDMMVTILHEIPCYLCTSFGYVQLLALDRGSDSKLY